jgi:hypothetical protein
MKLFVWKDVFCDYTCGIAFAVAKNKEEAIELIMTEYEKDIPGVRKWRSLKNEEPEVHDLTIPYGTYVSGSG